MVERTRGLQGLKQISSWFGRSVRSAERSVIGFHVFQEIQWFFQGILRAMRRRQHVGVMSLRVFKAFCGLWAFDGFQGL